MCDNKYFRELKQFTLSYWQDKNVRIYLFGSWARGEQRKSSDVDIAVEGTGDIALEIALFREKLEESTIIYNVDVVNMARVTSIVKEKIISEGILWKDYKKDLN